MTISIDGERAFGKIQLHHLFMIFKKSPESGHRENVVVDDIVIII